MPRSARRSSIGKARIRLRGNSLGEFTNFPLITHGFIRATWDDQPAKIQHSIVRALRRLNGLKEKYPISLSGRPGTHEGKVDFEIGLAEGVYFTYLDDETAKKICGLIEPRRLCPVLDFLVIVTYHYSRQGKNVRINFDYHQLRFIFNSKGFEMRLFHSKGIRRMPLEELLNRILDRVKDEMKQESLKPLRIEEVRVL